MLEQAVRVDAVREIQPVGEAEVLNGEQQGAKFSLVPGANVIGREPGSRIRLLDQSVSRKHAVLEVMNMGSMELRDLGSANGLLIENQQVKSVRIEAVTNVEIGTISLRITPWGARPVAAYQQAHEPHVRSPRVEQRFPDSERELPAAPKPPEPMRVPTVGLIAPILLGGAMFAFTKSPLSLVMMAFSPLMMLGTWLDNRSTGKRRFRRQNKQFTVELGLGKQELQDLAIEEVATRNEEHPKKQITDHAVAVRGEYLWTRRPEHEAFLSVRLGEGMLPSRTQVKLPKRNEAPAELWSLLKSVNDAHEDVGPVPVVEKLTVCGALGVAGELAHVTRITQALVTQLVTLHSPLEVGVVSFIDERMEQGWSWLKWIPHTRAAEQALGQWPLTAVRGSDEKKATLDLISTVEEIIELRKAETRSSGSARLLPALVILVLGDPGTARARLIGIAECGPSVSVHVIWMAESSTQLPAACRTFVTVDAQGARAHFVQEHKVVALTGVEEPEPQAAHTLARMLAPIVDAAGIDRVSVELSNKVNLRDIMQQDILSGPAPIQVAWHLSGSLHSSWGSHRAGQTVALAATVGQGPAGPIRLDLKADGPHALVGGTTGAGKSEFLQTWIMSMAATVSPERLNVLLVDYKGGAAFAECVDLPHTVGLVTDLSPHLVRRALTSLRAELRKREELLAEYGAKDLAAMEREGNPAAPPALVIVIDEFAALAAEIPEFIDGVIDIAQRGRSLGLHLIMATQRPAGVINDNLRANTNLRIALRMADEADSRDVVGTTEAALFPSEFPGRAMLKTGPGRVTHFQSGYLGGTASEADKQEIIIRSFGTSEGEPWPISPEERRTRKRRKQARDIERLRDAIIDANRDEGIAPPRRPWLDELPNRLTLQQLQRVRVAESAFESYKPGDKPLIGLCDDPEQQAQYPIALHFEAEGNLVLYGASGAGKTTALVSIAAELSDADGATPVEIYGIDASNGGLALLATLPTVGAVAPLHDEELVERILRRLTEYISDRGNRFAAARAASLSAYRTARPADRLPRVFLLVDGIAAFRQVTERDSESAKVMDALEKIMMHGRSVGVHVVLTADRPASIPHRLSSHVQQQFTLRLANAIDYAAVEVKGDALEDSCPGRAMAAGDTRLFQLALPVDALELQEFDAEIRRRAERLLAAGIEPVAPVKKAPTELLLKDLGDWVPGRLVREERAGIGLRVRELSLATKPTRGLAVVAGGSGHGVSEAALACVAAAATESQETALLTFAQPGLAHRLRWDRVVSGADEIATVARELADECAVDQASKGRIIVIERSALAEGTAALAPLAALCQAAKRAKHANILVICEFECGSAGGVWELAQVVKQPTWGVLLRPEENEMQHPFAGLGRVPKGEYPPGRGLVIEDGKTYAVQLARAAPSID
ncbi:MULTISPECIES: FtsK/SpoIIIE domain-containing protein [unclassified Leucobacter]|uniref:FtsK/SpoIIIE domain-containing protein n=1 Tax=unclassified Leucobacter TaxID=2621730 RepID=UPI00203D3132|nr:MULTISPECIES: FtsK/SpoIIIE domain-containing protein [unclassified Leucobacter]